MNKSLTTIFNCRQSAVKTKYPERFETFISFIFRVVLLLWSYYNIIKQKTKTIRQNKKNNWTLKAFFKAIIKICYNNICNRVS